MKISQKLIALAIVSMSLPALADGVATVNGKPIKQSWVDFISKDAAASGQKLNDTQKSAVVNELIDTEIAVQEAQKQGLDKSADFQANQELMDRKLLLNAFITDFIKKNPVTDAETKAAYEDFKKELGDKQYSTRHILVKTEAEAKDIIAQLQKGADFAKLAKDKSLDSTKAQGGDLGWISPNGMVKPFADAVVALPKGKTTATPVQTQFGWHVIKVENIRPAQAPAYDKVKTNIEKTLQQRKLSKLMADLRAKAKIDMAN